MNVFLVISMALAAFSAGLNIGRLATLWKISGKDEKRK